jgi:hypothetical protein
VSDNGPGNLDPTTGSEVSGEIDPQQAALNTSPDNLASPFLKNVPDADRPVVAKYIQDWDRGVQQRFQQIHNQYAPYKEFGDAEDVKTALELARLVNEDPQQVFDFLAGHLGVQVGQQPQQQFQQQQGFQNPWAEQGIPDEFAQQIVQMQQLNEALVQKVMGMDNATQEQRDQAALDDLLGALSEKYGDFNETFVMAKIVQGVDPEQAVQEWNQEIQNHVNSRSSRPAPAVLGGSGSVPQSGVDPRKMSPEDVRKFLADQLTEVNNQR